MLSQEEVLPTGPLASMSWCGASASGAISY